MTYLSAKDSLGKLDTRSKNGSGTFSSPFYGDLWFILHSLPPGEEIRLLPGDYYGRAVEDQNDFPRWPSFEWFRPGQTIRGCGTNNTKLVLHNQPSNSNTMLWSSHDGLTVSDMTVDANYDPFQSAQPPFKRQGITFSGDNCTVSRVRTIHASGWNRPNGGCESWALCLGAPNPGFTARRNVIEDCVVENLSGNYINGISNPGRQPIIRGCSITLPDCSFVDGNRLNEGHISGINIGSVTDGRVEKNIITGGMDAIYGEDFLLGTKFSGNTTRGAWNGFRFRRSSPMLDCKFVDTLIVLNGSGEHSGVGFFFENTSGREDIVFDNLLVVANSIRVDSLKEQPAFSILTPSVGDLPNIRTIIWKNNHLGPGVT